METLIPKGLQQILEEDSSLKEEITYEEFIQKRTVPQNSDVGIEEVYDNYAKIKEGK